MNNCAHLLLLSCSDARSLAETVWALLSFKWTSAISCAVPSLIFLFCLRLWTICSRRIDRKRDHKMRAAFDTTSDEELRKDVFVVIAERRRCRWWLYSMTLIMCAWVAQATSKTVQYINYFSTPRTMHMSDHCRLRYLAAAVAHGSVESEPTKLFCLFIASLRTECVLDTVWSLAFKCLSLANFISSQTSVY